MLGCNYLPHGYLYYVTGQIPEPKDPRAFDEKILARYGIDRSRAGRTRRKAAGYANLHYLRLGRFFVLLATRGRHWFFDAERKNLQRFDETPLRVGGYSISVRQGHAHVRMSLDRYREMKSYFVELAKHRRLEFIKRELAEIPFEPYAPLRRQLLNILRAMNRVRKEAGFERIPYTALRLRRRIVRPFEGEREREAA